MRARSSVSAGALALMFALGAACVVTTPLDDLASGGASAASTSGASTSANTATSSTTTGATSTGGAGGSTSSSSGAGGAFDPPWWDTTFSKRVRLAVENPAPDALPAGFQVVWPADGTAILGAGTTEDSLRIVRWDAASKTWTEIARVIEHAGGKAWLWFGVTAGIGGGVTVDDYWLYGDSASPPTPLDDPHAVFPDLYDSFDGGLAAGMWSQLNNVSFTGQELELDGGGPGGSVRTLSSFGPGFAVDFSMTVVQKAQPPGSLWIAAGFQRADDFQDIEPWCFWVSRTAYNVDSMMPEVTAGSVGVWYNGGTPAVLDAASHLYGVERYSTHTVFRYDGSSQDTISWATDFTTPLQVRFTAYDSSVVRFDYVRARHASDPAPKVTARDLEVHP